ncbi:putative integral membrane protein (TIGR00698 family) [Nitrobacteraceae bacterium AZCC 1564]
MPVLKQDAAANSGWRAIAVRIKQLLPGILLSVLVALVSFGVQALEEHVFSHPYIEALVIAILVGMVIRSCWKPDQKWRAGIAFSAKQLLEVAVALLGASISFSAIAASGFSLLAAIVGTVAAMLTVSYGISRLLGLPVRLSILVACGNSICGNSAIAAVAPVIGASSDDIASSISFTAILGVLIVLGLPLLIPLIGLSPTQYGIVAGLTVYAVPQVLAATIPAGLLSTQIGTLVKLMRVLTLGPVMIGFSLFGRHLRRTSEESSSSDRFNIFQLVPWFIIGFLVLAAFRSSGVLPEQVVQPLLKLASLLTIVSMAALGLGVDVRVIGQVGGRVTTAVVLSLAFLLLLSLAIARLFA